MDEQKGLWVWLDWNTVRVIAEACEIVLRDAADMREPVRTMNEVWVLWTTLVLAPVDTPIPHLKEAWELLEHRRGELTYDAFERCTACRRGSLPPSWEHNLPLSLIGRLIASGPPPGSLDE